jgi:nucleoside-diphosphate-sugar epimerase
MPPQNWLAGVDTVFHLAGIAHQQAAESAYRQVNELATIQLAQLAANAGVRSFVFLSSVKAMGEARDNTQRTEQACNTPTDAYGLSKARAESALRAGLSNSPMAVAILRPALVYGPAVKGNLGLLARGVRAGLPRPPELGARSMVASADLVDLMCIAAEEAKPGVQTWIATDGQRYSARGIYDQLREAAGLGVGTSWLPTAGWRLACLLRDWHGGGHIEPTFEKLFGTELYSNRAVQAATRWRPRLRLRDVAAELVGAAGAGA